MKILNEKLNENIVKQIGKFTILWAEYEKQYCRNNCNSTTIRDFAKNYIVDTEILQDFAIKARGRIGRINENEAEYVSYNLIPENANQPNKDDIQEMYKFIEQQGDENTLGAFLCIYRIRNNLLHGLKAISELNEQIELFKSMNKVLENIRRKQNGFLQYCGSI